MNNNNKTNQALLALLRIKDGIICCGCNNKLIIGNIVEIYKHYILLEAVEDRNTDFGYVVYDTKRTKTIESWTALTLEKVIPKWEYFKKEHEQKIL